MERICPVCGKSFTPTNNSHAYCSNKCKLERFKRVRPPKLCVICGVEFIPKKVDQKTCGSEACIKASRSKKQKRKVHRRKNMSDKTWNKLSPSDRWEIMTLAEVDKECKRFHLSYGQMQCLYHSNKLPESFGER